MTKLTSQQLKADEFKRSGFIVAADLSFCVLNFRDLFFSSTTIGIFIKTIVVSHIKQLKLPINNEKLINLADPGLLLLPA